MNKLIKKLTLFIIPILLIGGCAKSDEKWIELLNITPMDESNRPEKVKYRKSYALNQRKTIYIGDEIIRVQTFWLHPHTKAIISENIDVKCATTIKKASYFDVCKLTANTYPIKGTILFDEKNQITGSGKTFYLLPCVSEEDESNNGIPTYGLLMNEDGKISNKAIYHYYYQMLWLPPFIAVTPPNDSRFADELAVSDISPNYVLVYAGKNNVSLNISYKEYTADATMARPSFFQDLTYEANAKQIRFKDFILQIHEATNEKLDYSVIEDGLVDDI